MVWLDRPWLTHQALAIWKIINYPSKKLQQAFTILKRFILNPFKFAASIMNVNSKWLNNIKIWHSAFLTFLIVATGWLFLSLFPMVGLAGSYTHSWQWWVNLPSTICIMRVARWSPHNHDLVCYYAVNYPHHEGIQFMTKHFHKENSTAPSISRMCNIKFRMCLAIHYHIHDRIGKFKQIRY